MLSTSFTKIALASAITMLVGCRVDISLPPSENHSSGSNIIIDVTVSSHSATTTSSSVSSAPFSAPSSSSQVPASQPSSVPASSLAASSEGGVIVSSANSISSVAPASSSPASSIASSVVSSVASSVVSSVASSAAVSSAVSSAASSLDEEAVAIVDQSTYDGTIPLEPTIAKGTPGAALQTAGNPFASSYFYLSPDIKTMMDYSLDIVGNNATLANKIKFVQRQPSAVWMDSIATIYGDPDAGRRSLIGHLDAAVAQQNFFAQKDGAIAPMTVVVIIYNLPDRDCAAFASNGQLYQVGKPNAPETNNQNGLQRYKDEYLKVITDAFTAKPEYKNLRIVTMLEPDSFPNLITNTNANPGGPSLQWPTLTENGVSYCDKVMNYTEAGLDAGLGVYGRGLQLAIEELYKAGTKDNTTNNVYTYLDIGHAGWLGWDDETNTSNLYRGVAGFLKLIRGANSDGVSGLSKVRGFGSNTSGYTPTEEPAISNRFADREALSAFYEWNQAVDEMTYIDNFRAMVQRQDPSFTPGFIIDTARNGWGRKNDRPSILDGLTKTTNAALRVDERPQRGHWCNVNNAGVGEVPKASPDRSRPHLDAFFWMKPPGESDGISFDAANYPIGSAAYNALDAVDQAIVNDASDPKYLGKTLDTMCISGQTREGTTTAPVPELAPHAGGWFHKQFLMLIDNAHPELGTSEYN